MKLKTKIILSSLTTSLSLFLIGRFADTKTHGFSYLNFKISPPSQSYIEQELTSDVLSILSGRFTYLAHGGESMVFESEDKKWVLKFCKRNRIDPLKPLQFLRIIPFLDSYLYERTRVHERYFHSLKVQATRLKDLSFVSFIHFPSAIKKGPIIELVDPIGTVHKFDTTKLSFSLQRKGELFRTVFLRQESLDEKKKMLIKLVTFYKELEKRGVKIWDNAISRNMGWIDGEPFLIDAGSICDKPAHETFEQNVKYLKTWVIKYEPMLTDFVLDLITSK